MLLSKMLTNLGNPTEAATRLSEADPDSLTIPTELVSSPDLDKVIGAALQSTSPALAPKSDVRQDFQNRLLKVGASKDFLAAQLFNLINNSDSDSTKLRAIEKVLAYYGLEESDEEKTNTNQIQIVFTGIKEDPDKISAMVNPKR